MSIKSISKTKSYKKGRNFEYYIKNKLEKEGYTVIRSARSLIFDLIAFNEKEVLFIECKKQFLTAKQVQKIKTEKSKFKIPENCKILLFFLDQKGRVKFLNIS